MPINYKYKAPYSLNSSLTYYRNKHVIIIVSLHITTHVAPFNSPNIIRPFKPQLALGHNPLHFSSLNNNHVHIVTQPTFTFHPNQAKHTL